MLDHHGKAILNSFCACQPDIVYKWAVDISGEILAKEGQQFAESLCPTDGQATSNLLQCFLLERIMSEAADIAPTLCQLLQGGSVDAYPGMSLGWLIPNPLACS